MAPKKTTKKNTKGGFAFAAPLLAAALGPIGAYLGKQAVTGIEKVVKKVRGKGVLRAGDTRAAMMMGARPVGRGMKGPKITKSKLHIKKPK
jgi:hypothetical protein